MNKQAARILKIIIFILSIFLVVYGQRTIGKIYLLLQLIGLAGLIGLLWNYNRKYV